MLVLALSLAASGLLMAFAGPADACPTSYTCVYKDAGYSGGVKEYFTSDSNHVGDKFSTWYGPPVNDAISSVKNRFDRGNSFHYKNAGYSGSAWLILRGNSVSSFSGSWNDSFSSLKWVAV